MLTYIILFFLIPSAIVLVMGLRSAALPITSDDLYYGNLDSTLDLEGKNAA